MKAKRGYCVQKTDSPYIGRWLKWYWTKKTCRRKSPEGEDIMQEGVHHPLYDGPILVKDLRRINPYADCFGENCRKIILHELDYYQWYILDGKPFCSDCFKDGCKLKD